MAQGVALSLSIVLLVGAGCAGANRGVTLTPKAASADSTAAFQAQSVFVYVDGERQGITPATVQVRRSFGASQLSLRTGPKLEVVRTFDIEWAPTSSRRMLDYSFSGTTSGGMRSYDAGELSVTSKGVFIIPYYEVPIQIEDREYNLTIIVID